MAAFLQQYECKQTESNTFELAGSDIEISKLPGIRVKSPEPALIKSR